MEKFGISMLGIPMDGQTIAKKCFGFFLIYSRTYKFRFGLRSGGSSGDIKIIRDVYDRYKEYFGPTSIL